MSYDYITSTGTIVPDTSDTKTTVEDEYKSLYGADLVVDDSSPEGLMINAEVEQRDSLAKNNADLANQINPNLAEGVFLDGIFALTGAERISGAPSTFSSPVDVTGEPATLIPQGSQAKAGDNTFETTGDVVLDGSGLGTVAFQAIEDGAIQVAVGELNQIIGGVLGWETVSNPVAATPGRSEQTDQAARLFRKQTLAIQGISMSEAVFSKVRAVDDVTSLSFRENVDPTPEVVDGIPMLANSVFACVAGGTDSDVALALLKSKSGGANWTGDVIVPTVDPFSGQTYDVALYRPTDVPILCVVTVSDTGSVVDPTAAIKEVIVDYANGEIEGEVGFVVGADVSPFELSGAVTKVYPSIFVDQVEIDTVAGGSPSTAVVPITLLEQASITEANISVVIT